MNLSPNFTLEELCESDHAARLGIDNWPDESAVEAMRALCVNVLQPLRDTLGPITITSGFRSWPVNRAAGGSSSSQHLAGEAADLKPVAAPIVECWRWLICNTPFDQIIWEFGTSAAPQWIHVSHSRIGPQRGEMLRTVPRIEHGRRVVGYVPLTLAEAMILGGE